MSEQSPPYLVSDDPAGDLALLLGTPEPRTVIIPELGIHENISDEIYHRQWEAVSNSRLTILHNRTAAHLKASIDNPAKDTAATLIGRAIHTAILEPGEFWKYVRGPEGDRRSNAAKARWAALENEFGVDKVLRPAVYDAVGAIRASVHARPKVMALLTGGGHKSELSIVWRDEKTGLLCKARIDHVSPDIEGGALVDVKSTEDASREGFEKSIFTYGYHRQAAMYLEAAWAVGIEVAHFVFIAVEKKPPYGVGIYRADGAMLAAGRAQLDILLPRYKECFESNEWPCYSEDVEDIGLPYWALKRIEDETRGRVEL